MRIEHYSFGRITIDGKTYTSDVIIFPKKVNASWWRKQGHNLEVEDLADVLAEQPEVLVIGTGAYGVMQVPQETADYLAAKGIEVHIAKTNDAVGLYNKHQGHKVVVAALHLTC